MKDKGYFKPLNIKKRPDRQTAVALRDRTNEEKLPEIAAAGYGEVAKEIIRLADENGIKVREDSALAEMLAQIEIDSPIPSEAFAAVAEILSYLYKASGKPNPFDISTDDDMTDSDG